MKGNVLVGQSGGPTAVINSSLAGVYKTAMERGFTKVYGMRYGIQGFMDEQYVDMSEHIKNELDLELLKRTPSAFLGTCRRQGRLRADLRAAGQAGYRSVHLHRRQRLHGHHPQAV